MSERRMYRKNHNSTAVIEDDYQDYLEDEYDDQPFEEPTSITVERPKSINIALKIMQTGALASLALSAMFAPDVKGLMKDPTIDPGLLPMAYVILFGFFGIISATWLITAALTKRGKSWARIMASVFTVISAYMLLSTIFKSGDIKSIITNSILFGCGAAACYFLWQRESTHFYQASAQKRYEERK